MNERLTPFVATHPGELIRDELKVRGLTQKVLAERMNMKPSVLNEIIKGKRAVSSAVALALEKTLEVPATLWMNLQANYEIDCRNLATPSTETTPDSVLKSARILIETILTKMDVSQATHEDINELERLGSVLRKYRQLLNKVAL